MIPAGYMAKHVVARPEWLKAESVRDFYSVSGCVSKNLYFKDEHGWRTGMNGHWLYDSPEIVRQLARAHATYPATVVLVDLAETVVLADLTATTLFFYEIHELEYDEEDDKWAPFEPDPFPTRVATPSVKTLEGYDVATFSHGDGAECSPLSCNRLATEVETNEHCLLPSLERAEQLVNEGRFNGTEPGPFRVYAVYSVQWPTSL